MDTSGTVSSPKAISSLLSSIIGLTAFLSVSCASGPTEQERALGKTFSAPVGKSLLYVYRPSKFVGMALRGHVWINKKEVGRTANGTFMAIPLSPGKYSIQAGGGAFESYEMASGYSPEVKLDARAGETYFIRQNVTMGQIYTNTLQTGNGAIPIAGGADFTFSARQVDSFSGKSESSELRQIGTTAAF